jgi:NAD(P)-dependent dehydrogenase (short-subunit alcohol dehydrogenase family)
MRVVVVTGAGGGGCGRAIASRFALNGAAVVVSDIDDAGGRSTVEPIERTGGRAAFYRADVGSTGEAQSLIAFAASTFGRIDVLVSNASAPVGGSLDAWAAPLETDLLGAVYTTRWAVEAMRATGGGAIVNVASASGLWHGRTTPGGLPGYDVAKGGMIHMTSRLASLAQSDGIRVNCLAPGWINTDGPRRYWESLAGRVLLWWSDDAPRLIAWGDRGYHRYEPYSIGTRDETS